MTTINPTIALSAPSGLNERRIFAQRYHIHTILTCHQPGQANLSQNTNINESIIVAVRHDTSIPPRPSRFINLDRFPTDEAEVADLHQALQDCPQGSIPNGWGEVSHWPAERIQAGDWASAIWRSHQLAQAANYYATHPDLSDLKTAGRSAQATGQLLRGSFEPAAAGLPGRFPILKSKGADSQTTIQSVPDESWIPKKRDEETRQLNGGIYPQVEQILQKAGHLLITAGQDNSTGRLTAVASDDTYVGNGWMPVTGLSPEEAKAIAVFVNSTAGRLQLMRNPGRKLTFPAYSVVEADNLQIPNIKNPQIRQTLAACWETTKNMPVPQYRDGECEVRQLWDAAVAEAMGWDANQLTHLRHLLHNEPHVRGLGYNQYADAPEDDVPDANEPATAPAD